MKTSASLPIALKSRFKPIKFAASERPVAAVHGVPAGLIQHFLDCLPWQHRTEFQALGLESRLWSLLQLELGAVSKLHLLSPETLELPARTEFLQYAITAPHIYPGCMPLAYRYMGHPSGLY